MSNRRSLVAFLIVLYTSSVPAAAARCEVTRFGLPRETVHPGYASKCVCATELDKVKALPVADMRLAAACDVHHLRGKLVGAFYHVGAVKISGSISRETDATSTEIDPNVDKLIFQVSSEARQGWPHEFDLSPGYEHPEFGAPAPSIGTRCWRAKGSMDIRVVRVLSDVKSGLIEGDTWDGFFPIVIQNIQMSPYAKCK